MSAMTWRNEAPAVAAAEALAADETSACHALALVYLYWAALKPETLSDVQQLADAQRQLTYCMCLPDLQADTKPLTVCAKADPHLAALQLVIASPAAVAAAAIAQGMSHD